MVNLLNRIRLFVRYLLGNFILKSEFGRFGKGSRIGYPCHVESPIDVSIEENVNIRYGLNIINNKNEKVIIKKYTTLAPNITIVTNNHIPVVGVPIYLLTSSHVNDKSTNIIIEEDCWIGEGVKILAGSILGRGCVVGAGTIVTKAIPPYAVVVGCPAKIVGVRFIIEHVLDHEKQLYPPVECMSREYLELLYNKYYNDVKVLGEAVEMTEKDKEMIKMIKEKFDYVDPEIQS